MPHIFAATALGMFHAFGWAQMAAEGVRGGPVWRTRAEVEANLKRLEVMDFY